MYRVSDSPVTISLFPTSIDLDPIFEKDRDLDRFRFSYRAGQSVVLNTLGGPGATLDCRVSKNAIIGAVAAASSRRPPLLKSRPRWPGPLCIHWSAHELGGMAPSGSATSMWTVEHLGVHTLLGRWTTRTGRQLGMVKGGERGGGHRRRPSAVIPSYLNGHGRHQKHAAVAKPPRPSLRKERIMCLETKINKWNKFRSRCGALCRRWPLCNMCFMVVSRPTKCIVDLHK